MKKSVSTPDLTMNHGTIFHSGPLERVSMDINAKIAPPTISTQEARALKNAGTVMLSNLGASILCQGIDCTDLENLPDEDDLDIPPLVFSKLSEGPYGRPGFTIAKYSSAPVGEIGLSFTVGCSKIDDCSDSTGVNCAAMDTHTYFQRAFSNILQLSTHERLSPSTLYTYLCERLMEFGRWRISQSRYCSGTGEREMYRFTQPVTSTQSDVYIVSSPVHVFSPEASPLLQAQAGNLPLTDVLEAIRTDPNLKSFRRPMLLCPLAQSHSNLIGLKRQHWTLVAIQLTEPSWKARHYDSKGPLYQLYSLSSLEKGLPPNTHLTKYYLGHQGVFNTDDCGYFIAAYITQILKGVFPEDLNTTEVMNMITSSG
eukprot:TRINITY_DN16613_c0_g1::TRINITY_DN16613_c0_g1_i1::g.27059::m.27059 TRINITY_DN16613_c0_g1::TRINITY_DN16613_c0_g1_i1::g.27059  ORF type:complete len:369 (+),score=0.32 TRINITY_DN16613_c0_g1_i1:130-1236(+)